VSLLTSSDVYQFGFSLGRAGDINGDSYSDIVIGTYVEHATDSGTAFFYGGTASGVTSAPIRIYPAPDGFEFGYAVGGSSGP
jgi:hypothetical protein